MTPAESVARAIAFFDGCDDIAMLHQLTGEVAPRAKRLVTRFLARGTEDDIPAPAELRAARTAAPQAEALKTLRTVEDFALLQVMARAIGRRIEAIEIAASAEFPEGTRVSVPAAKGPARLLGEVEETGTMLQVLLDNGETWQGPPSVARLASAQ